MSDIELIHKIKRGSHEALEQLFESYQDGVRRMVMYTLGNKECVDDVAQEVFIELQKSIQSYTERSKFSTWLFSLVRNVSLQYIRKHMSHTVPIEESHIVALPADNSDRVILQSALRKVESKYRDPLVLKEMEGFSYEEIASILSIKEGTVKSRIHTAKQQVLAILNKGGFND